jgi:hypothetical protein
MTDKNKSPFTENEFNSGDGMMTSVWGPATWLMLHTISFNYPVNPSEEQKKHYYKFFKNLKNILPCRYCRENLEKNLKTHKLNKSVFKNRESLSRWVYELHEMVNKLLGKTSGLSYEDVRDRYEHFRSRCLVEPGQEPPKVDSKEKGCTEPLYGEKSKCILKIVPQADKGETMQIDKKCIKTRSSTLSTFEKVEPKQTK